MSTSKPARSKHHKPAKHRPTAHQAGKKAYTIASIEIRPSAVDITSSPDIAPYRDTPLKLQYELLARIGNTHDVLIALQSVKGSNPILAGSHIDAAQQALQRFSKALNKARIDPNAPNLEATAAGKFYRPIPAASSAKSGHASGAWIVEVTNPPNKNPWKFDHPPSNPRYTIYVSVEIVLHG